MQDKWKSSSTIMSIEWVIYNVVSTELSASRLAVNSYWQKTISNCTQGSCSKKVKKVQICDALATALHRLHMELSHIEKKGQTVVLSG